MCIGIHLKLAPSIVVKTEVAIWLPILKPQEKKKKVFYMIKTAWKVGWSPCPYTRN
jgi:hypothetical protein